MNTPTLSLILLKKIENHNQKDPSSTEQEVKNAQVNTNSNTNVEYVKNNKENNNAIGQANAQHPNAEGEVDQQKKKNADV